MFVYFVLAIISLKSANAGIPIVMAVVDGKHKEVRIGQVFQPTEDLEVDMKNIQGYFTGVVGINPRR